MSENENETRYKDKILRLEPSLLPLVRYGKGKIRVIKGRDHWPLNFEAILDKPQERILYILFATKPILRKVYTAPNQNANI